MAKSDYTLTKNVGSANTFIVETPLQLLNAIEAKHAFESTANYLVLLLSPPYPVTIFQPLFMHEEWTEIHTLVIRSSLPAIFQKQRENVIWKKLLEYYQYMLQGVRRHRLNSIASSIGHKQRLFIGNYLIPHMRHFANTLPHDQLYVLDDGTDTIRINDNRKNCVWQEMNERGVARIKRYAHRIIHEFNDKPRPEITFFTAYDIDVRKGDALIRNDYRYLRTKMSHAPKSDEVFFIGQCLVDDEWTTLERYLAHLEKAKQYLSGHELVYIPHPRESSVVVCAIEKQLGVKIIRFRVPIEYQLITGTAPKEVASFFSSALENLRIIFGNTLSIKAFCFSQEDLLCCQEFTKQLYEYWRHESNSHFQIIS